jgi:hypothetical protein
MIHGDLEIAAHEGHVPAQGAGSMALMLWLNA